MVDIEQAGPPKTHIFGSNIVACYSLRRYRPTESVDQVRERNKEVEKVTAAGNFDHVRRRDVSDLHEIWRVTWLDNRRSVYRFSFCLGRKRPFLTSLLNRMWLFVTNSTMYVYAPQSKEALAYNATFPESTFKTFVKFKRCSSLYSYNVDSAHDRSSNVITFHRLLMRSAGVACSHVTHLRTADRDGCHVPSRLWHRVNLT